MKIQVRLSEKQFIRFSLFDVFHRRKGWRTPSVFALIMGVFAVACFVMRERRGAVFLGGVLLAVAIGLPLAYFLSYFLSLSAQAKAQKLAEGKYVYTLDLNDEKEIRIVNRKEHAAYPWEQVYHVYRNRDAIYLYITERKAFLIPFDCVNGEENHLWALLERKIPEDRRSVL